MFTWTKVLAAVVIGSALLAAPAALEAQGMHTSPPTKLHTSTKHKTVHRKHNLRKHTLHSKTHKATGLHSKGKAAKGLSSKKAGAKGLSSSKKSTTKLSGHRHHPQI